MKIRLIVVLLISLSCNLFAQENWTFSPDLGINMIPIDNGDVSGVNFKAGASFGISAHQQVEEKLFLNYGINFNRRFASYQFEEESTELEDLLNFGGIPGIPGIDFTVFENTNALTSFWTFDVPISLSFKTSSGFLFYGGGYINFLISAENDEEYTKHIPVFETINPEDLGIDASLLSLLPQNESYTRTNDSKTNMNNLGYGMLIGFGYQSDKWLLRFGYQHGFNDIYSDKFDAAINIKNQRAFSISFSYLLKDLFLTSNTKDRYNLDLVE